MTKEPAKSKVSKPKANAAEAARRVAIVQQLLIKGFTSREIEFYAKENWDINRAMTHKYIKTATEGFYDLFKDDVEAEMRTGLERRLNLYRKMEKQAENPKCADVALKILQDISRLKGQYVERSEVKHEVVDNDPLAPVALTINVIERNADIQQAPEQGTVQPETDNA